MGKTLAKQRKKAARQAEALAAQPTITKQKPPKASEVTQHVTDALSGRKWEDAVRELALFRQHKLVPKLGALQRWVRLADLSGQEDLAAALLDAMLRAAASQPLAQQAQPSGQGQAQGAAGSSKATAASAGCCDGAQPSYVVSTKAEVARLTPWVPPVHAPTTSEAAAGSEAAAIGPSSAPAAGGAPGPADAPSTSDHLLPPDLRSHAPSLELRALVSLVPQKEEPAKAAGQEVAHGITQKMWQTKPGAIRWGPDTGAVRVDVPMVPGAFVCIGALRPDECRQIVALAEAMGYEPDVDYSFGLAAPDAPAAASGSLSANTASAARGDGGERASGCVWLADESLLGPLYARVKHLLPQELGGGALAGLNCRLRLYRYDSYHVYRPHVDGAWPGSGLTEDGKYVFDKFGDRWSRLTFLVYLNDGFEGGCTTFFTPDWSTEGRLLAQGVQPRQGNILVFPHGDTSGSLVHEGSTVTSGAKYVIRTEVLYMLPPKPQRGGGPGGKQQKPAAKR